MYAYFSLVFSCHLLAFLLTSHFEHISKYFRVFSSTTWQLINILAVFIYHLRETAVSGHNCLRLFVTSWLFFPPIRCAYIQLHIWLSFRALYYFISFAFALDFITSANSSKCDTWVTNCSAVIAATHSVLVVLLTNKLVASMLQKIWLMFT